jgi:hypothetical protein
MSSGIEGDTRDIAEFSARLKNCAITVDILKYLNGLAIDLEYNRQIVPEFLDETIESDIKVVADDRFPVVLLMAMPHYHRAGERVDTHIRMFFEVIVKSKDGTLLEKEYSQVAVDVPIEALEILPNIPDVRWLDEGLARKDRKDVWNNIDKDKLTNEVISQFEEMLKREEE